ncbi:(2Fe-2S)-binding protein [Lysinibacillus sp. NPDC093688]|uniref:(2Fe-2S)-binding protein n=1 Tax=Lysinibacillus sp. NPDC093688 TaxID=3390577 RepID=UPI003D06F575
MKDVIICRCEEVSLGDIEAAKENGLITSQEIKMATRLGMGMCQGRICRSLIDNYMSDQIPQGMSQPSSLTVHVPVRPVSLCQLAAREDNV